MVFMFRCISPLANQVINRQRSTAYPTTPGSKNLYSSIIPIRIARS